MDENSVPYDIAIWARCSAPWELLQDANFNSILEQTVARHKLQLLTAKGLVLEDFLFHQNTLKRGAIRVEGLNKTTKGGLRCYLDNQHLVGASYIQAGVYLANNVSETIAIGEGCFIQSGAYLEGPIALGNACEIRQGAYIRNGLVTGTNCIVGHSSELKHVIMHDHAKAPHFAYVGDSILGAEVNLGAGTKVSNLKITGTPITLRHKGVVFATGMRKLGGILGDKVETGCNAVLNPGVIMAKKCAVYPAMAVAAGIYPEKTWILPEKR